MVDDDSLSQTQSAAQMSVFMTVCVAIQRYMFEAGLPLRGAIHHGEVVISNRCLGGKGIVDALDLANNVNAAVCVVSQEARQKILRATEPHPSTRETMDWIVMEADVCFKTGSQRIHALNWLNLLWTQDQRDPQDIGAFVRDHFAAHGKSLNGSADEKARNTRDVLEYWLSFRLRKEEKRNLRHSPVAPPPHVV